MNADQIKAVLQTTLIGQSIHCLDTVDSTNSYAGSLAEAGAADGTVVLAEEQTQGRGRLDRTWHSVPGLGLWMSIIVRPKIAAANAPGLSLVTGLALAVTIEEQLQISAKLKWPNDCLLSGQKVAGILLDLTTSQKQVNYVVVGVGINVRHGILDFPPDLQETATSLVSAAYRSVDRISFLAAFLARWEQQYLRFLTEGLAPTIAPYTRRCSLIGCQIDAMVGKSIISGKAIAIDPSGALVITDGTKKTVLTAGEVVRVR